MAPASCPPPETLQRLVAGLLPECDWPPLETHVEGCRSCQGTLDRLTDCSDERWAPAPSAGPAPAPEPAFLSRLGEKMPAALALQVAPDRGRAGALLLEQPAPSPLPLSPRGRGVGGEGAEADDPEATELLYRRMRLTYPVIALVQLYVVWLGGTGWYGDTVGASGDMAERSVSVVDGGLLLLTTTVDLILCSLYLWAGLPYTHRALRLLETGNFLFLCLFYGVWEYGLYTVQPRHGPLSPSHQDLWLLYATAEAQLLWLLFMITQGLILPKGPWRCAGMMALANGAALVALLAAAREPFVAAALPALAPELFVVLVGVAVGCVASSRKLRVLEQAVREAQQLGPYQLQRVLGAGGMGEVYLAEHRLLKRPCAVKIIRPERVGDPSVLRRFEREVRALASLRHPNTVDVFDYGHAADGTFFYVMEYLPGLSLQELVSRYGPPPPARAVHLVRQLCAALREAHGAGLIHRDLKPGNVLVCDRGPPDRAKLLDFGLFLTESVAKWTVRHSAPSHRLCRKILLNHTLRR